MYVDKHNDLMLPYAANALKIREFFGSTWTTWMHKLIAGPIYVCSFLQKSLEDEWSCSTVVEVQREQESSN